MTKKEIVKTISEEIGLTQLKTKEIVQKTFDAIVETLCEDGRIELRNFGVFEVKVRKARVGRNPNNPGTDVPIPQRAVVKFKPGKDMREDVLKLTPAKIASANAPGATLTSSASATTINATPNSSTGTPPVST